MGNYWIIFNKNYFSFKNLCDLCVLCGSLNCYPYHNRQYSFITGSRIIFSMDIDAV